MPRVLLNSTPDRSRYHWAQLDALYDGVLVLSIGRHENGKDEVLDKCAGPGRTGTTHRIDAALVNYTLSARVVAADLFCCAPADPFPDGTKAYKQREQR